MNHIKQVFHKLDQDQKDVLKSSLITIIISVGSARFLDGALMLIFILFPLQLILGESFSNINLVTKQSFFLDRKSRKAFSAFTAFSLTLTGLILIITSIVISSLLEQTSFLALFVLFIPLLVTRAIVFCNKLPLSVLYCLMLEPTRYKTSHTRELVGQDVS